MTDTDVRGPDRFRTAQNLLERSTVRVQAIVCGTWMCAIAIGLIHCGRDFDCVSTSARLLRECRHSFGEGIGLCNVYYPPEERGTAEQPGARTLQAAADACVLADPNGDERCYLTESCEAILGGECNGVSLSPSRDPSCLDACLRAGRACATSCIIETRSADACDACIFACNVERVRCDDEC